MLAKSRPIDILLGAKDISQILLTKLQKDQGLIYQNAGFDWILSGNIKHPTYKHHTTICMISCVEKAITRF